MERYKLPAGRLATVFYKVEPKEVPSIAASANTSDCEKLASSNEDLPPEPAAKAQKLPSVVSHSGLTLAWKDITLELKAGGEEKRLLNNLSGEILSKT